MGFDKTVADVYAIQLQKEFSLLIKRCISNLLRSFKLRTKDVVGSGEMAGLTRNFNWGATSLGPISDWSDLLLGSVNLMICCRFPCAIFWGPEMVKFYNDDYMPLVAEKHPKALGQEAHECWKEAWHVIGPQLKATFFDGTTLFQENVLIPVVRGGQLQDVYWTYSYSPIHDCVETIVGIMIVCHDTTAEVLAARALARMQEELMTERTRLKEAFQQAPAFIAVLRGPDHIFEMVNPQYEELVGDKNLLGKRMIDILPETVPQQFIADLDQVYQTGETQMANSALFEVKRSGGEASEGRYLDYVCQAMREADGAISGVIALGVDVSERRRAERTLMDTEKLAAVGRLASSIAHEINNPLEAVTNLLYLARKAPGLSSDVAGYLDTADQELRRVASIANQTLTFYKQAAHPTAVTGEAMFASVLAVYRGRLLNSGIRVAERNRAEPPVACFEGEIRQVLSNLVGNAIDAMRVKGGRLLLRSRVATAWLSGKQGLMLTVADSGTGIHGKDAAKIFEAFFTTKGSGGNGLGLWVSHEIVDRHQGSLRMRSRQTPGGSGTVFTLFLPFDSLRQS